MRHLLAAALIALLPVSLAAQDTSDEDKGYITRLIEDNLSGDERVVNLQGFEGALSSEARIAQLTVADSEGVWLTLENVVLAWNRSALLRGVIDVETLAAERIVVARAPVTDTDVPTPEAQPFSLPELPVSIRLDQLDVDRIELGPDFLGEPLAFAISGSARLADGEGEVNITADRLDAIAGRFAVAGSFVNETRVLTLDLDLEEAEGGLAATQLDLPGDPAVALNVTGEGPLSNFAANLTLATDGQERLAGVFTLLNEAGNSRFELDAGGNIAPLFAPEYQDFFGTDLRVQATGAQLPGGGFDLSDLTLRSEKLRLSGSTRIDAGGWPERIALNGAVESADGDIVLLPIAGPKTFVDRVNLDIGYDRSVSDDWTAEFGIVGFDRPGLFISQITLSGGGQIIAGTGTAVGEVTANLSYAARGVTLDDAGAAEAFGDSVSGVLDFAYQEGQPTRLNRLTLDGPGLEVLAEATVATPEENLRSQISAVLSVEALSRFATLSGQPGLGGAAEVTLLMTLSPLDGLYDVLATGTTTDLRTGIAQLDPLLRGDGDLSLQAVRDTGGTRLEGLRIATSGALVTAEASVTSGASEATFAVEITEVALVEPSLAGPARVAGEVTRDDDGRIVFAAQGRGPDLTLEADGTVIQTGEGQTINADVRARVADLTTYRALTGQDLGGAADVSLSAVVLGDGQRFDADLTAQTTDLRTGIARIDPLLDGPGTLIAELARTGATRFRLDRLTVETGALELSAQGAGDWTGALEATLDATVREAGAIAPGLVGPLNIDLTADRDADGVISADLVTRGAGTDVVLDGTATPQDGAYRLAGRLDADLRDLAPFSTLAGRDLGGALSAEVTGSAVTDLSAFDADLTLTSRDLALGDARLDPILAGEGRLAGMVARQAGGAATATLTGAIGGTRVDLDAVATPQGGAFAVEGAVSVAARSLVPFRAISGQPLSGQVQADLSGRVVTDLSAFDADITVTTADLGIGNATVDPLIGGAGSLQATAQRAGEAITIRDFRLSTAMLSASGALDARSDGTGEATFAARLADVGVFTDQLSGPVTAEGRANRVADRWQIDVDATGPGGIAVSADGSVADSGTLDLSVTGSAPLGLANDILEPRRLSGDLAFDLRVAGPPALSSVSGRISTAGARLAAPTLGQALEDITGGVTLNGAQAQVDVTANVPQGGGLRISGPVGLAAPYDAALDVALDAVILSDPNLYETVVDGRIGVNGPLAGGARITGTLNLGETNVQVPSSGVGALGELPDVVHVGERAAVRRTLNRAGVGSEEAAAEGGSAGPGFPLDLTINAPNRVFIRGRGVDAELGGSLAIGGTSTNVIPTGQFELIRGRLDILQQRFELTDGSASLQGDFIPYLRLEAETEAATGTLVRIIVQGPANAPDVIFSSVPDLPQDEVLSQLIFGRNLSEISPLQAVQLAAAVGTLAGRGGGGLIDNFRQNIGLDDFDVTTDAEGNAAVRAGKYLTENVYTDVTINAEGETEINLNLDITRDITAKGTVEADGETSLGIFFERDY